MPKRKRDFDEPPGRISTASAKQQRVDQKLEEGKRKLAHAFKIAKGFERQKLGRREKTARSEKNDKDVVRIESEITALKTLETSASAHICLYKTLSKIKTVVTSGLFTALLSVPPPQQHELAAQNIHARLCNSKPVKEALSSTLHDVLQAAHIQSEKKKSVKKKHDDENTTSKDLKESEVQLDEEDSSMEDLARGDATSDISADEAYAKFEHRLASSDDEVESDADDTSRIEQQLRAEGIRGRADSFSGSDEDPDNSADESDFNGFDSSAEAVEKLVTSKKKHAITSAKTKAASSRIVPVTSSMLLPSLTMGGYISASEGSEAEDIDEAPKKNRPGQRARQALAEKKYGAKAKHLKSTANSRDDGWDAKRGATGDGHRGVRKFTSSRGESDVRQATSASKPRTRDDDGPLHPSWVAAKLAKEKKAAIPAFTGKKISFD